MTRRKQRPPQHREIGSRIGAAAFVGIFVVAVLVGGASSFRQALAGQTAFNYTANLLDGGARVTDTCDFQFGLYDQKFGGRQIGQTNEQALRVEDSVFTARLNFGRRSSEIEQSFLDILVHCPTLTERPAQLVRQSLSAKKPFDIQALSILVARELGGPVDPEATLYLPDVVAGLAGSRLSDHRPWSLGYYEDPNGEYAASGPFLKQPRQGGKAADTTQGHDGAKAAVRTPTAATPPPSTPGARREDGSKGHRVGGTSPGRRDAP